jgi:stage V sporulation protein AC
MSNNENQVYKKYVHEKTPKTNEIKTLVTAFIVGGLICMVGEAVSDIFKAAFPTMYKESITSYTTITMIFLGVLFTGIGIYDDIGKFAGAGSIVPITGFANSVVSPAMEYKTEGYIYGVESKMFTVAGPIIVSV